MMRTELIRPEERYSFSDQRQKTVNETSNSNEKAPQSTTTTASPELTNKQLEEMTAKLNKAADIFELNVQYKVKTNEETNTQIVQIVKNDEVIAEMPPERLLDALAKIEENLLGVVVDERV